MSKSRISVLLESEMEQAQLMLAVKDIADQLQNMAERVSKISVEDLPAIVERIKAEYGVEYGMIFEQKMKEILENLLTVTQDAKSETDNESLRLSGQDVPNSNELESHSHTDRQDINDFEDEFGGEDSTAGDLEEPTGRVRRESVSVENLVKTIKSLNENKIKETAKTFLERLPVLSESIAKDLKNYTHDKKVKLFLESLLNLKNDISIIVETKNGNKYLKKFADKNKAETWINENKEYLKSVKLSKKKVKNEGNAFSMALKKARDEGKESFKLGNKEYIVKEDTVVENFFTFDTGDRVKVIPSSNKTLKTKKASAWLKTPKIVRVKEPGYAGSTETYEVETDDGKTEFVYGYNIVKKAINESESPLEKRYKLYVDFLTKKEPHIEKNIKLNTNRIEELKKELLDKPYDKKRIMDLIDDFTEELQKNLNYKKEIQDMKKDEKLFKQNYINDLISKNKELEDLSKRKEEFTKQRAKDLADKISRGEPLSKQEWENEMSLKYDIMPSWWWNPQQRDSYYHSYLKSFSRK